MAIATFYRRAEQALYSLNRRDLRLLAKKADARPARSKRTLVKRLLSELFGKGRCIAVAPPAVVQVHTVRTPLTFLPAARYVYDAPLVASASESSGAVNIYPLPRIQAIPEHRPRPQTPPLEFRTALYPTFTTIRSNPPTPLPLKAYIKSCRHALAELSSYAASPTAGADAKLRTLERLLPRAQRVVSEAASMLDEVAWTGYYVERDLLSRMKTESSLWDGSASITRRTEPSLAYNDAYSTYSYSFSGSSQSSTSYANWAGHVLHPATFLQHKSSIDTPSLSSID
ncbi:hypothetical protein MKEN_00674300 [Mycena kentingensis (nom. inval.)]|nr:hypothetical protein MKEN_00674300 [Mycena kentingensis (nom. inval.)]